jgi:hypothetical protein
MTHRIAHSLVFSDIVGAETRRWVGIPGFVELSSGGGTANVDLLHKFNSSVYSDI